MSKHLHDFLPGDQSTGNDALLGRFLEYTESRQLQLYPAQESAMLELFEDKNVILNTPTGSGKSLVATALHFLATARGCRSVYTCPIKALVNEKFMALCRDFGPDRVGLSPGDATVNHDAPILCCTAEILANIALRERTSVEVKDVSLPIDLKRALADTLKAKQEGQAAIIRERGAWRFRPAVLDVGCIKVIKNPARASTCRIVRNHARLVREC